MKKVLACLLALLCVFSLFPAFSEEGEIQETLITEAPAGEGADKGGVRISSLESDQSVVVLGVEGNPVLRLFSPMAAGFIIAAMMGQTTYLW